MTEQELQIAVCERLGWKIVEGTYAYPPMDLVKKRLSYLPKEVADRIVTINYERLPRLTLEFMHEAEKTLTKEEFDTYEQSLWEELDCEQQGIRPFLCANAIQRATAFIAVKQKT